MATYLDGQSVALGGDTLGAVIDAACDQLDAGGRIIVEVEVNGLTLVGDELTAARAESVAEKEVRLVSAVPQELAVDALQLASQRLNDARSSQGEAADLLQQDQSQPAFSKIGEAVTAWQQTQMAVLSSSQLLGLNLDEQLLDNEPVSETVNALIKQLRELHELLLAADTVALADALAYEWPETIDRWQQLINQMIQWVEKSR